MKYIIEIEEKPLCVFDKDTQTYFPRLWRVKGFNSLVFDEEGLSRLEELNSDYINEHYGELQDTAYQNGFEDGKKEAESSDSIEQAKADAFNKGMLYKEEKLCEAYQRGLDDAWECGKKLAWTAKYGGYGERLSDVFGRDDTFDFYDYTPNEAIAKLKAYEEKQNDKFEFGDEIIDSNGVKGCVISMNNEKSNTMYALFNGYKTPQCITKRNYRKTGKHYDVDDIKKLLEEMRHD